MLKHGNIVFYFPVDDPYLFTDTLTFHFIPPALTGYDPLALKAVSYLMFFGVVGIFSMLEFIIQNAKAIMYNESVRYETYDIYLYGV